MKKVKKMFGGGVGSMPAQRPTSLFNKMRMAAAQGAQGGIPASRMPATQGSMGGAGKPTVDAIPAPGGIKPTIGNGGIPRPAEGPMAGKPLPVNAYTNMGNTAPVSANAGMGKLPPGMGNTAGPIQTQKLAPGPNPMLQSRPAMKKGGKVSSASKRADGCAIRGKTKGRFA